MDFEAIAILPRAARNTTGSPNTIDLDSSDDELTEVCTYRPSIKLLSLLNPTRLVLLKAHSGSQQQQYRITRAASTVIASWTELRQIELVDVDLVVFLADGPADADEIAHLERAVHFFLGPSIVDSLPLDSAGSDRWAFNWRTNGSADARGDTVVRGLLQAMREGTLVMPRVRHAAISVGTKYQRNKVEEAIAKIDKQKRAMIQVQSRSRTQQTARRGLLGGVRR